MASHGLGVPDRPHEKLRGVYKKFQKLKAHALDADEEILDLARGLSSEQKQKIRVSTWQDRDNIEKVSAAFADLHETSDQWTGNEAKNVAYEHADMPGLFLIPSLLSPRVQTSLLSCIMHRDLSDPAHKTNLHTHYELPYADQRASFFTYSPATDVFFWPNYPDLHKPLSISQALSKKLRWITLGGQYNWTDKRYPAEQPPQFPRDIATLLHGLFPTMTPEAAIVNFYSPGDTLSLHRDVSEESGSGLASLSIGCDGVFIAGRGSANDDDDVKSVVLRLRSGDAIFMDGPSRYAWHGVPQIISDTCPSWLEDWPATGDSHPYELWKGWMRTKRVNLNARQMWR